MTPAFSKVGPKPRRHVTQPKIFHVSRPISGGQVQDERHIQKFLRPFIVYFALVGIFPNSNVFGPRLRFRWLSIQTIYNVVITLGLSVMTLMSFKSYFDYYATITDFKIMALYFSQPIYYVTSTMSYILGLRLATALPTLTDQWNDIVVKLRKYSDAYKPKWMPVVMATLIFTVSMAIDFSLLIGARYLSAPCQNQSSVALNCYFREGLSLLGPSNVVQGFELAFSAYACIGSNFPDLIIIILSLILKNHYEVINHYLRSTNLLTKSEWEWRSIREDHYRLSRFVTRLNHYIAPMVLMTYGYNVYSLCCQIYYGFRYKKKQIIIY